MISIMGIYNTYPDIFENVTVPEQLDKATLISTIVLQNAELELLYSEPVTLKMMIDTWSESSQYTWNKLAATLDLEYNPIWNKDGTIKETESVQGSGEGVGQVSGFDSANFQNRDKQTTESESSREYERIEQGNIGVTSTQQLIKEEREISEFNIYDRISEDFRNKFCLMVY